MEPVLCYMLEASEACRVAATTLACKNSCVFFDVFFITYAVDIMGFMLATTPKSPFSPIYSTFSLSSFFTLLFGLIGVCVIVVLFDLGPCLKIIT